MYAGGLLKGAHAADFWWVAATLMHHLQIMPEKATCICTFHVWKSRSDHMWRLLGRTAEFWGHQSWFWLNPWQTRINSGRFTSSEIHECPASASFAATLDNVMHNIEFQPVCEFEPACSLKHDAHEEPTAKSSQHKEPHQDARWRAHTSPIGAQQHSVTPPNTTQ